MRYAILISVLALAACEAPRPDNTAAETISEKQAITDAEEMIAENAARMETAAETEAAGGESE